MAGTIHAAQETLKAILQAVEVHAGSRDCEVLWSIDVATADASVGMVPVWSVSF
ncbi:hypothetical protein [Bacillus sp. M6-12]|uniref:hypothetical protein n=1 Tax=Bacillus sp. M6-12 TaxID=2054166 RepID=UPI0015E1572B|nr:hypothetical protein [Bacillus sp. M6-12]